MTEEKITTQEYGKGEDNTNPDPLGEEEEDGN